MAGRAALMVLGLLQGKVAEVTPEVLWSAAAIKAVEDSQDHSPRNLVLPPPTFIAATIQSDESKEGQTNERRGFAAPDSDRLRVLARFMASYFRDDAQRALGFEKQGRLGYVIVEMWGRVNDRVSYRLVVNPVNESQPKPACGEEGFFYPNEPAFLGTIGPNVRCDPEGNRRVDMYKFISFDRSGQPAGPRQCHSKTSLAPKTRRK